MTWQAQVLTLFPEMFPGPLGLSLAGRALENRRWALEVLDIRDFAYNKHRAVDDTPAGGGPGMVMRADVAARAIDAARARCPDLPMWYLSARGKPFCQADASALAAGPGVALLCGRFEGIDQRVLDARAVTEVTIGDYVLSGGEPAALVVLDAAVRLLPGVMGKAATLDEESFEGGLLEYPHYTRPAVWEGQAIPPVLLSGDHQAIRAWRRAQAELETQTRRPDLWAQYMAAQTRPPSIKKG